ncbi:MAG: RdgB/HAM1 family non-canonical purine NTP pyrophosphatase [Candidatus Omnitrophota bacterium]
MIKTLTVATRNNKKLFELRRYLRGAQIRLVSLRTVKGSPEVEEDGMTFKANASKKALETSRFTEGLVLADDSGLVVDALKGEPGVRSARFAGDDAIDIENNAKLLRLLKDVAPKKRTARFVCHVAIADNGKLVKNIEENCKGLISYEVRGRQGFGYDPLFLIPKYGKTFGELGLKVKDTMSHRSKALRKAVVFLKKYR